jgi:hypothetical protein
MKNVNWILGKNSVIQTDIYVRVCMVFFYRYHIFKL